MKYRYPCTRHIEINGFGAFLESESKHSRRNINLLAEELKQLLDVPYMTMVNSGSSANLVSALTLAEKVKSVGKPLTAAISAFTFPTTVSALILAGFELTVVDVEKDSFCLSYDKLLSLGQLPSVIAVTHFLGFPCEIEKIAEAAHSQGSFVLQDACETLCMKVQGKPVYSYGDISTLSFYHPHHLSSYGGGAVVTLNQDDYVIADSITHWGRSCKCHIDKSLCTVPAGPAHNFTYERLGLNVEMSELNACFGRWQLQNIKQIEMARTRNYDSFYEALKDVPSLKVWPTPDVNCSPFVFPIRLKNGMTVRDAYAVLAEKGIEIRTLMGGAISEQEAFHNMLAGTEVPVAKEMADTTFFVGVHHTLPNEDVETAAQIISRM